MKLRKREIGAVTGLTPIKTPMGLVNLPRSPRVNKGINTIGTPSFPGTQGGQTIEAIRDIIYNSKKAKGFEITADTGTTNTDIKLSGNARLLLGFAVLLVPAQVTADTIPTSMTLTINNEIVIDQANPKFFSPEFCDDEYYFIPRPLSGTDEVQLSIVSAVPAQKVRVIFYYI